MLLCALAMSTLKHTLIIGSIYVCTAYSNQTTHERARHADNATRRYTLVLVVSVCWARTSTQH